MQYFKFMTHDEALMWSRLERICVVSLALGLVPAVESQMTNPSWLFTILATLGAGVVVLKCWVDMILLSRPFENCWAFKE
jgi:hypothetical protein